jgi:hypothetical protein
VLHNSFTNFIQPHIRDFRSKASILARLGGARLPADLPSGGDLVDLVACRIFVSAQISGPSHF